MKWKGAWSDNSKEWDSVPEEVKRRMSLRRTSDGEFWMSYEDFTKLFSVIEVCNFSPEDAIEEEDEEPQHDGKWFKANVKSKWIAGKNSGGFKNVEINPQILMTLEASSVNGEKCSIVVTLMQHSDGLAISFFIYHVGHDDEILADMPMKNYFFEKAKREEKRKVSYSKEVKCSFKLSAGKYLIVPFNRTCESGEFLIRVFSDTKCELKSLGGFNTEGDKKIKK